MPTTKPSLFATVDAMALDPSEVGARIALARKEKGWTHERFQDAISEALGHRVSLRTVQRWQKGISPDGKSWLPRLPTLAVIADVLEVSQSYLVESDLPPSDAQWREDQKQRLDALERSQGDIQATLAELLRIARGDPEDRQSGQG